MMADRNITTGEPELKSGYTGDEEPSRPEPGPPIRTEGLSAEQNRGRRAPQEGSGVVIGSGAAAGGGGGAEDHDSDPQAGDGALRVKHLERRPVKGGDAPVGGSR
ncbi:MAG: hypothetical protein JF564_07915 [Sphingomonas sp.]|nr:hypothetical protein [Sphingomonas sp.]